MMSHPDGQQATAAALVRRNVVVAVRARLAGISSALSDLTTDSAELREDANELNAVAHRIEWLADIGTASRS
jgi:hypothetical protein